MVWEAKGDAGSGTQGCGALNTDCGIETRIFVPSLISRVSCGALNTDCGFEEVWLEFRHGRFGLD